MIRARTLAALAVVAALLAGLIAWWMQTAGMDAIPVPWTTAVALLTVAVIVLGLGLPVRRWTRGDHSRALDPLRAARTVALAKAAGYGGAALCGWYFGLGIGLVADLAIAPREDRFIHAMGTALAAFAVCVVGLLVERWCRRPPDEDEDTRPA